MKGQRSYKFVYDMPGRKTCITCGIEKDISEFKIQWRLPDERKKKDAHMDVCKMCDRQDMLKYIDDHPEHV